MRYRLTKANLEDRVHSLLTKAVETILADADRTENIRLKISALLAIGNTMEKLADKYRVDGLTLEHGPERISKARGVMEEALDETYNCYRDNPDDAIDNMVEAWGEWGKLSEALDYLENTEDSEDEEA